MARAFEPEPQAPDQPPAAPTRSGQARFTDGGRPVRVAAEPTTAELVQHATEQMSRLIRDELALARSEMADKARHAGVGAGLLGGSGVVAHFAVGVLIIAAVLGLAVVLPAWLSALIVGAALLILAGLMALGGRLQLQQATPAMPERVARSVRADVDAMTNAVRNRGRQ
jgi:hypothetical protein